MTRIRYNLSNKERKDKIIEYITNHPGCKMDDIVKAVENDMSRTLVFGITAGLINEKILENRSKNRRDLALYINNDSILLTIEKVLNQFEEAYFDLLNKSKKRLEKKDFSFIAKTIGLSSPDPKKWNEKDKEQFHQYELKKRNEFIYNVENLRKLYNKIYQHRRDSPIFETILDCIYINKEVKKYEELKKKFIEWKTESEPLKDYFEKLDSVEWTKEFECNVILNTLIKIFFLFTDITIYRLTLIWSFNMEHKHIVQQIRSLVFDRISKFNVHLLEFINSISLLFPREKYIKEIIIKNYEADKNFSYFTTRLFYRGLKMENEIIEIIKLLDILDPELKQYGYVSCEFYSPRTLFNSDYELLESFTLQTTIDFLNKIINNNLLNGNNK